MFPLTDQRKILYHLKKDFGRPCNWVRMLEQGFNSTTGQIERTNLVLPMKTIPLPREQAAAFQYSLTFLARNSNFQYGGTYDVGTRDFIFDSGDFPVSFEPSNQDRIIFDGKEYEVKSVSPFDLIATSIMVTAKATEQGG